MKKPLRLASYMLLFVLAISACKKDSKDHLEDEPDGKQLFVSATSSGNFTATQLKVFATAAGFGQFAPLIEHDVEFFKIIYKTTYKGNETDASGLLAIPKGLTGALPLLSAQHGTMFKDTDAPSNFPGAFTGFELFASTGFVTVIPDYIGYGTSKDIVHPYYDMQHSGQAVIDMIKAAKYYQGTQDRELNDKLFLVGYSEGGYVTMAAQREIETNGDHDLSLTAVAAGAGGYDLNVMMNKIATEPAYQSPSFLTLIIQSYNTTYNWNRPLSDFFAEPYASRLPALLDGSKTSDEINAQLSTTPSTLLNPAFYANLNNATGETELKAKLQANSFPNWHPKTPTRLYHGTADEAVFFESSQVAYERFTQTGSPDLTLIPIPGGTHATSIYPMMADALPWFKSLAQ